MIVIDSKHFDNEKHKAQFDLVMERRQLHNHAQSVIVDRFGGAINHATLQNNYDGMFPKDFWLEIDRNAIDIREDDRGREVMTDLMGISTPLSIGKTVKAYTMLKDVSDNVAITIDGNGEIDFDHADYSDDADPVPIFEAGFGVSWRLNKGLTEDGIELITDTSRLKTKIVMERMADYLLSGAEDVVIKGKKGQGLKNHRNTIKIDLTVDGIDLANGDTQDIMDWFTVKLPFHLDAQFVEQLDVMWVSPEIMRRLQTPLSKVDGFKEGTLLEYIKRYGRVRDIRRTYKNKGNEWFGYIKSRDSLTPLVGSALATVPVPRVMPMDNYNFLQWGALGMQVKRDINGRSSVFYAANLT